MKHPLRIVHIYNQLDPTNGGPPHVIVGLAAGQQALGHQIGLVSEDPVGHRGLADFLAAHLSDVPIRHAIHPKLFVPAWTRQAFEHAIQGADIVHMHGIWPSAPMMASRTCRAMGIPYVVSPHGSLHRGALTEKMLKKLVGMWTLGYREYLRHAAAIHFLNASEKDGAQHPPYFGVRLPSNQVVMPNGIFPAMLERPPKPGAFSEMVQGIRGKPYILFLSRLHPGKGLDLLAHAFAQVARVRPDVHLVLVGQDQGAQAGVEAIIAMHRLEARVHFTGPIFDNRKMAAYADAAVFCLPSRHEGFSMAITEALAWARPVVITKTCHFPEVSQARCGLEVDLNADEIAEGLLTLLNDPVAAQAMGERGREMVLARFTWPAIAARMVDVYHQAIASQGDRR
ncbi:MAG: glycosyltransferase [Myxococcota bacterium]|nr:glycosyltransferase [Myxococcota bacterium]